MGTQGLIKKTERFNNLLDSVPEAYMRTLNMNEYMIVMSPHEELRNRIMDIKKKFAEKYKTDHAKSTKPHLMLARFKTWSMLEDKITDHLDHIAMGATPFKVELKDFGSFPAHTIHINVTTKVAIMNTVKELKTMQRLMKADPAADPFFMTEPFIAIGRKLIPWQYEQAWLEYSHKHFTGRFIADHFLLLKKELLEKSYRIVKRFEFKNLPITTRQGALFA